MRSGRLRHRVSISEPLSSGGWKDVTGAWVAIEPLQDSTYERSKRLKSDVPVNIRARYDKRICTGHFVRDDRRVWEIVTLGNIDERNCEFRLNCRELMGEMVLINNCYVMALIGYDLAQISIGQAFMVSTEPKLEIELLQAQLSATPKPGDTVQVFSDNKTYTIDSQPSLDDGVIWRFSLK